MGSITLSAASGRSPRRVARSRFASIRSCLVCRNARSTWALATSPPPWPAAGRFRPRRPRTARRVIRRTAWRGSGHPGPPAAAARTARPSPRAAARRRRFRPTGPEPKGSPGSRDGFMATTATAIASGTPTSAHRRRRLAARSFAVLAGGVGAPARGLFAARLLLTQPFGDHPRPRGRFLRCGGTDVPLGVAGELLPYVVGNRRLGTLGRLAVGLVIRHEGLFLSDRKAVPQPGPAPRSLGAQSTCDPAHISFPSAKGNHSQPPHVTRSEPGATPVPRTWTSEISRSS